MLCFKIKDGDVEDICENMVFLDGEYVMSCCNEMFHLDCLNNWFKKFDKCPKCDYPATNNVKQDVYKDLAAEWHRQNPDSDKEE